MSKLRRRNLLLLALMLTASVSAAILKPSIPLADELPVLDLNVLIPKEFGAWRNQHANNIEIIDPGQQDLLNKLYSQSLTRTYVNGDGDRIMLSIAYGKDQRDSLQLHQPEVCYPAQGFRILNKQITTLTLDSRQAIIIPVTRLDTVFGNRHEQVTYWMTVGQYLYTNTLDKKLAEMRYGLKRRIPDGMLVRISSIDSKADTAYAMQASFASQMFSAIPDDYKIRFASASSTKRQE